ncbi:autoinducer binding domain-containing protein [Methylacidiphilum caldifontis]|uniref:helix-turn-helix transcriptional regulator n=1 Tax=Methylacidiphilum caldifontis TaxID=2795386 RepID=UPI001A8E068A|nr:LuxR family transcriptional regulator [Methylacidiphilum caldifontis]QSR89413.1 autoinducer binding domain-containing protein [Methylacidiphilum caldifontis]
MKDLSSLSKIDLLNLLEIYNSCLRIGHQKELHEILKKIQNLIPSSLIACGLVKIHSFNEVKKTLKIINHSFPNDLIAFYLKLKYQHVDPVVKTALRLKGTIVRRTEIFKYFQDKLRHQYLKDASDIGLLTGLSFGVIKPTVNLATLFSFCDKEIEKDPRHETILKALMYPLHLALLHLAQPQILDRSNKQEQHTLTDRELEILKWVKEGKSNWEISCILNISEATVKFHLKNIFLKLEVQNRCQAVATAIYKNLLTL